MAFKNKSDNIWSMSYDDFRDSCEWSRYEEFYKLIDSLKDDPENTNKENALKKLYSFYGCAYRRDLVDAKIKQEDYNSTIDWLKARNEYSESEELKKQVEQQLETNQKYKEKKEQIENADEIVSGRIWDTSGGLLEWAIRNGFIEQNFPGCHVITWNVG